MIAKVAFLFQGQIKIFRAGRLGLIPSPTHKNSRAGFDDRGSNKADGRRCVKDSATLA